MPTIALPIEPPPTHQAALRILKTRDGRQFIGKTSKSSNVKWSKTAILLLKSEFIKHQWKTLDVAVQVGVLLVYPNTKDSAKIQAKTGEIFIPKSTRPDVDNVVKTILDCLVDSQWITDDGLIVELSIKKVYGKQAAVFIDIDPYSK
jgi:Holliday junction resolvase RusA-like endonuclease